MARQRNHFFTLYHLAFAASALTIAAAGGCWDDTETGDDGTDAGTCGFFTECRTGDGCCPASCNERNDRDCEAICGDGVVSPNEICEPLVTCPLSCDDGIPCTHDVFIGSADNCTLACQHTPITWCTSGDGCCVASCGAPGDADCRP